jgi:hypothetical protein
MIWYVAYSTREMYLSDILWRGGYKSSAVHVDVKRYPYADIPKEGTRSRYLNQSNQCVVY